MQTVKFIGGPMDGIEQEIKDPNEERIMFPKGSPFDAAMKFMDTGEITCSYYSFAQVLNSSENVYLWNEVKP
jgi:hypothetical protein